MPQRPTVPKQKFQETLREAQSSLKAARISVQNLNKLAETSRDASQEMPFPLPWDKFKPQTDSSKISDDDHSIELEGDDPMDIDNKSPLEIIDVLEDRMNIQNSSKPKKAVRFTLDQVRETPTWSKHEYDRSSSDYFLNQFDMKTNHSIRQRVYRELNELKMEMEVHPESRRFTAFEVLRPVNHFKKANPDLDSNVDLERDTLDCLTDDEIKQYAKLDARARKRHVRRTVEELESKRFGPLKVGFSNFG